MTVLSRYRLAILFAVSAVVIACLGYGRLPDPVPVHWNLRGVADGWISKPVGPFVVPGVAVLVTALLIALEPWAVKTSTSGSMRRVYPSVVAAVSGFLAFLSAVAVIAGMSMQFSLPSYVTVGLGILLVILGNIMGKTTRNPIVGIRTPWTLASDEVWLRTHRIGGWILALAGLAIAFAGMAGYGLGAAVAIVLAAAAISVASSYVIYRQLERSEEDRR